MKKQLIQTNKKKLIITPLGGVGEFGKNMTLLESSNEILIIDCGIKLLKRNFWGLNAQIVDSKYLLNNKEKIVAVLITHGHLDHIGGLPFIIKKIKVPIYAPNFACLLIKDIFLEKNIRNFSLNEVREDEKIEFKNFTIFPIEVDHSIVDSFSYAIETPCGTIIHSGDYRNDPNPYKKNKTNLKKIKQYANKGILALLSDSTNVIRNGTITSESVVFKNIEKIIKNNKKGRIIFSTFSTQINRIQQVLDIANKLDYKVFFSGLSMLKNVKNAIKGYYQSNYENIIKNINDISKYKNERVIIISTGTQGEENSSLHRMALGNHKKVRLLKDDLIVFSSSVIPGNDEEVANLIDLLTINGNRVITNKDIETHSSGHGSRGDLMELLEMVRPVFFIPVHGRHFHLLRHKDLAIKTGVNEENIFLLENGQRLELTADTGKLSTKIKLRPVYLEGGMISTIDEIGLRQRSNMMMEGVVFISLILKDNFFIKASCVCQGVAGEIHQKQLAEWITEQIKICLERDENDVRDKKLKKILKEIVLKSVRDAFAKNPEVIVEIIDI